jgi:TolB protein
MGIRRNVASTMKAMPVCADLAASCPSTAASSLPVAPAPPQQRSAGTARPRARWKPTVAVGAAISVLAAGCGGTDDEPAKARAASEPPRGANIELPGGRIAFRRYLDDAKTHGAIFTVNPDGSEEKQLTEPPDGQVDDHPDWSPDGKRIAFERCAEDEPCTVFTVAATGGRPEEVHARCELRPTCDLVHPAWTPDGRLLVTLAQGRARPDPATFENWIQQSAVELLDLDTGRQRTIVERRNWTGDASTPAASPDGRTVIYRRWNSWRSKPAEGQAIFAVDFDGSDHRRLTPWKLGGGDHPGFSPDGTILFRSYEQDETKQSDYWTVRPDGKDLKQLTHHEQGTLVLSTSYSPDGKWIVHATNGVDGTADVFVMRADGTDNQPVTRSKLWDSAPDWGPAGS